jgi:hypothetical protein
VTPNLEPIVSNPSTPPFWLVDPETVDELERRFAAAGPPPRGMRPAPDAHHRHIPDAREDLVDVVLYVSINSLNCGRATSALQALLAQFPQDAAMRVRIVDVAHDVESAVEDRVLFTPTLIVTDRQQRKTRVLGDLSNLTVLWEILVAAGIEPL